MQKVITERAYKHIEQISCSILGEQLADAFPAGCPDSGEAVLHPLRDEDLHVHAVVRARAGDGGSVRCFVCFAEHAVGLVAGIFVGE